MVVAIGCDHAGLSLKKLIIDTFTDIEFKDLGTYSEDSCDYPDYCGAVGESVAGGDSELGVVICGSGVGASISANKVHGIRASLCFNEYMAEMTRKHNDSNVLALGARIIGTDLALSIVKTYFAHEFEGGRHQRRVDKMTAIEDKQCK